MPTGELCPMARRAPEQVAGVQYCGVSKLIWITWPRIPDFAQWRMHPPCICYRANATTIPWTAGRLGQALWE
eukprot:6835026-Alexandrium_andersonii.AAC.1